MIHKLEYSYYTKKAIINGRTKFKHEDFRKGILDFDTNKYWDDENNYYNVVSDFLQDSGVKKGYMLTVIKKEEKDD